jgi:penicillin-binding protein activator
MKGDGIMRKTHTAVVLVLLVILFITSCASLDVNRVKDTKDIDLSGSWNDTDIRLVSEDLIKSCLRSDWLVVFNRMNKRVPVVIVGNFHNLSAERIDTSIITKKIEAALVNSGKIILVASNDERSGIRDERIDQQLYSNPQTTKAIAMETGADFMLIGSVKTVTDRLGNKTVQTYYVSAELVELETTRKVWLDEEAIKKVITRPAYSW